MIPLDPSPEPEPVMQGTVSSRETANGVDAPVARAYGSSDEVASRNALYPFFSPDDAERLAFGHRPETITWDASSWYDEEMEQEYHRPAGSVTICTLCHDHWGAGGCATLRAVTAWRHNLVAYRASQDRLAEEMRRTADLTEALTPRFGVSRLNDYRNDRVELRMVIDNHSLIYGGLPLAFATLERMAGEFRVWFRKVGDKQRIAADHLYALTLDSDYYTHLTQDFKMTDGMHKEPFAPWNPPRAPWDDPTWKRPSHPPVSPSVGATEDASDATADTPPTPASPFP